VPGVGGDQRGEAHDEVVVSGSQGVEVPAPVEKFVDVRQSGRLADEHVDHSVETEVLDEIFDLAFAVTGGNPRRLTHATEAEIPEAAFHVAACRTKAVRDRGQHYCPATVPG